MINSQNYHKSMYLPIISNNYLPISTKNHAFSIENYNFAETLTEQKNDYIPYTIQTDDNLANIARKHLSSKDFKPTNNQIYNLVSKISSGNNLENPDLIYPGQTLQIPILDNGIDDKTIHNNKYINNDKYSRMLSQLHDQSQLKSTSKQDDISKAIELNSFHNKNSQAVDTSTNVPNKNFALSVGGPYQSGLPLENYRQPRLFPLPNWKQLQDSNKLESLNTSANNPTVHESRINNVESPNNLKSLDINNSTNENPWMRVLPESAVLTSEFGSRRDPFTGERSFHNGIDLAAEHGTPIRAYAPGTIVFSGWQSGYGKVIIIRHDDGHESVYGHNAKNLVRTGERVNDDSVIGLIGTTGRSTGPHLHFEIRVDGKAVNPIPYLSENKSTYKSAALQ